MPVNFVFVDKPELNNARVYKFAKMKHVKMLIPAKYRPI